MIGRVVLSSEKIIHYENVQILINLAPILPINVVPILPLAANKLGVTIELVIYNRIHVVTRRVIATEDCMKNHHPLYTI